jgi:sodium/proline symporter
MTVTVVSFGLCLLGFVAVGLLSARHRQPTTEDYLVAGRSVSPWLAALSSVATNNSGFMFIGLIGFTYRFGVQAIWLQLGWIVGDVVLWALIHRPVRERSGRLGVVSLPAFIGATRDGGIRRVTVVAAGVLTFFFLGGYAAAQLKAGSTALHSLFGWDLAVGAIIGAVIVVLYCFSGGLRASVWTDAAQAIVMLGSMAILLGVAIAQVGGPVALYGRLEGIDPALVQWLPDDLAMGFGLYLLGFVFGGLGAVGQPHIMIRTMAIRSPEAIPKARRVYFAWYVPFSVAAVGAGLYARVLLPELLAGGGEGVLTSTAENALPLLTIALLPEVLVGLSLAGIFAATMSTADSQLLACSAAITQDVMPRWSGSYLASKLATLAVAGLALAIALWASQGVFDLVLVAWSVLGAGIGPLVVLRAFGRSPPEPLALAMMASGVVTVLLWGATDLASDVFKLLPGMLVPFCVWAVGTALTRLGRRLPA